MSPIWGQEAFPLLKQGATWVVESHSTVDGPVDTALVDYRVSGDTLIDGRLNMRLFLNNAFVGGLREEAGRLIYQDGQLGFVDTLLDFNLTVGDTMLLSPNCDPATQQCPLMVVNLIDSLQILDGSFRKRLNLIYYNAANFTGQAYDVAWIDGIGSTGGILANSNCGVIGGGRSLGPFCEKRLICHQVNGEVLFANYETSIEVCDRESILSSTSFIPNSAAFIKAYPNPVYNQLTIERYHPELQKAIKGKIFNQLGGKLAEIIIPSGSAYSIDLGNYPRGMYHLKLFTGSHWTVVPIIKR